MAQTTKPFSGINVFILLCRRFTISWTNYLRLHFILGGPMKSSMTRMETWNAFSLKVILRKNNSFKMNIDFNRISFFQDSVTNLMGQEFKRMKFDNKIWRLSDANEKFELCPTYLDTFIIPNCMTVEQMKKITTFRSSKRFPAVVWRS